MSDDNLEWHAVAKASELEDEEPEHARIGDTLICVVKLDDGIFAINDVCTHEFAQLSEGFVDGEEIECPLHQATFNLKTGEATAPPADDPVETYPVKIEDDQVYVGFKKQA
jgi:nitrite reductase/ring-hydroxylating ferredoxin subunit